MVTGYQRQHRKSINYIPDFGADPHTTDQYTRIVMHECNTNGIHEEFSRACELACISGMTLVQPYLDFTMGDPAQGTLKLKTWEYNAFLIDPYMRDWANGSDCQFVWCQEYISKLEAEARFPDKVANIAPMSGTPQRYGSFYFLPENYNMARNDLMVLSYVWYKWTRKKKMLYSRERHQFFDFAGGEEQLDEILYNLQGLEVVEVDVPTWKLAVCLNDQLMYQGNNPLGFDDFPFIPIVWNYEPHINYYDLRARGLVRTMRDTQFLLNRRIIINHDISESVINTGYKRKVGAVANEDNLKRAGQGYDIVINEGYDMTDVERIQPQGVPESDMALADQLWKLIFATSGVDLETWQGQAEANTSALSVYLKQAGSLMILQKYFDQWDLSLKVLGDRLLKIILNNWNAAKTSLILGEEPSPHFYSKIFAKYQVVIEEGANTATQKHQEFHQLLELNQITNGAIPASYIISKAPIQGITELQEMLQQQEQAQSAAQQQADNISAALDEAKIKELTSKAVSNIATARERHGRAEADIGLFEERLSEITHNRAMAQKAKMEALAKLIETIKTYGDIEAGLKMNDLQSLENFEEDKEETAKADAKRTSLANDFVAQMLSGISGMQGQQSA